MHDPQPILCRAVLYAREAPGRRSRARLERRLARLAAEVGRLVAWQVAAYVDCSLARPWARPGLCALLADAPWAFDLVVVDGYPQLAAGRSDLATLLGQLASAGVQTVVAAPSPGRRAARLVGNLALSDLVAGAIR